MVYLFTIGFTKKSARTFFGLLQESGAVGVMDVRLNNVSQLAGFAKRDDLDYFLKEIAGMRYSHRTSLAPTQFLLDEYKKRGRNWDVFEAGFLKLMNDRRIEETIDPAVLDNIVLLCSEEKPHRCHRRLTADYLQECWGNVDITHLI